VAAVEDGLHRLRTDLGKIEDARNSIAGILQRARPPPSNPTPDQCKALSTLIQDDSIIIPADKGRSTVILNKPDYDQKIKALLSDQKTYKRLQKTQPLPLKGG